MTVFRRDSVFNNEVAGRKLHPELITFLDAVDGENIRCPMGWDNMWTLFGSRKNDIFRLLEGYRSPTSQAVLGEAVTKAAPMMSYHQYYLAADVLPTAHAYDTFDYKGRRLAWIDTNVKRADVIWMWEQTGLPQAWKSLPNSSKGRHVWGGDWSKPFDPWHFAYETDVPVEDSAVIPGWWNLPLELAPIDKRAGRRQSNWSAIVALAVAGTAAIAVSKVLKK